MTQTVPLSYSDQAATVAAQTGHTAECAYHLVVSVEEDADLSGLSLEEAEVNAQAADLTGILCYC